MGLSLRMERVATSPIILLIEDEESIRSFFEKAFKLGGYASVAASTAEAAPPDAARP